MKKCIVLLATLMIVATPAGMALAYTTTIDFEGLALGSYSFIIYPEVIFTNTAGDLRVSDHVPGLALGGTRDVICTVAGVTWNVATFTNGLIVHSVSVAMGDDDFDPDPLFLNAYDKSNNLLATFNTINPASVYGGPVLSVSSASNIAYVQFNETGTYWGSAYFDNFTYSDAVTAPISSSLILFGSGLFALVGLRYRKA